MTNGSVYTDMRGPLGVSTAAYEQELFYCEFSHEEIEQVRVAFGGDLEKASEVYRKITNEILTAVSAEDVEKPLVAFSVEDLIAAHAARVS
jgi:hypothetical protein